MSLSKLLQEMQFHQATEFAKSAPLPDDPDGDKDDDDIRAAAALANGDNAEQELDGDGDALCDVDMGDEDEDGDDEDDEDGVDGGDGGDGAPRAKFAKSFRLALDDGQEVEAYDATDLVKSLSQELGSLRTESISVMQQAFDLIKSQNVKIDDLTRQVKTLGMSGRGRRSVLSVSEKGATTELAKSTSDESPGMSKAAFFAKAATAQRAGRLTAQEISVAEAYSSKGMAIPDRIVARVMAE